jgi:hypothetical protein
MADNEASTLEQKDEITLEGGAYEIIQNRLKNQGKELRSKLDSLNQGRKEVFGSIETKLLNADRITTDNNCIARDMVAIGPLFIFGYNVHIGLKSEIKPLDVFSVYAFENHTFVSKPLDIISDEKFVDDFKNLYKYYRDTRFSKFSVIGVYLYMAFQVGKNLNDIKVFKWLIKDGELTYVDNRSDYEFKYPPQHEFEWIRTRREQQRRGRFPHISIDDRIFVETTGGDLTIKVEDNTETGEGIYAEVVENPDQSLDDAEIYYASLGNIILLKIKPYQEKDFRYIVYNEKMTQAKRIDAINDACILLPDDHGLIFSNGYYLQNGEYKTFEHDIKDMTFDRRLQSPNGEDFLFIFYQKEQGVYILLSYNLIEQKVKTPVICNGYAIFSNGETLYFKSEQEPQKHHVVQIWQTPYVSADYTPPVIKESYLYKIGNKDIVRCMAECYEIYNLIHRDDSYANLYLDIVKKTGDVLDSYLWLKEKDAFNLAEALEAIKSAATSALDEFEKVRRIKKNTQEEICLIEKKTKDLLLAAKRSSFHEIDQYVQALAEFRTLRGEIISLKDLRYADLKLIESLESEVSAQSEELSKTCVDFLMKPEALATYGKKVSTHDQAVNGLTKGVDAKALEENINAVAKELELLIEIVSALKIDDPTKTSAIIDSVSDIYTRLNQSRAALKKKKNDLLSVEATAEFNSQIKLLSQGALNYLDVCDTPQKTDEYLTKLMIQIEELEGKFVDFDEFTVKLSEKRDEIYSAFESKKMSLLETRNKRAAALQNSADRILKSIQNRIANFKSVNEINGYFASDLMIDKARDIVKELVALEDTVKADDIQTRLKSIKEDAVRQLKDRQELFVAGDNLIKFGDHVFSVNTQPLDGTMIAKDGGMYFHLTGTNFFEKITDPEFLATSAVWEQDLISENRNVYRCEFLAFEMLKSEEAGQFVAAETFLALTEQEQLAAAQKFMSLRYDEGYVKGVHDLDAMKIIRSLFELKLAIQLLRYPPQARSCALIFWKGFAHETIKKKMSARLSGVGDVLRFFSDDFDETPYIDDLSEAITEFIETTRLFAPKIIEASSRYLYNELAGGRDFVISKDAALIYEQFFLYLTERSIQDAYDQSLLNLRDDPVGRALLIRNWLSAFMSHNADALNQDYIDEAAALAFTSAFAQERVADVSVERIIADMRGDHPILNKGEYRLNYIHFVEKLNDYHATVAPLFRKRQELKKRLIEQFKVDLRLDEFKPKVLTSFVRNQLIDKVYLKLIGDNLAKQIGVVGEQKRTDRMGLLLLISPPGYGKTTLMEYIANRLGIIFMKINGPAIGHQVTSLDPDESPNASAKEEVKKINLSFEMGDNVMIYLDDIQHCNPELLQKFISLCDAQRRIEGVYKGATKTYDFRGKKVCVVMAGNPYTESGEKFKIPDMLANRADTYNLGDIIGNTYDSFVLSYIENCLTSNPVLNKLATKSTKDIYSFLRMAEVAGSEGLEFEGNYSIEEMNEYVSVLKKLMTIRDVLLKVNQQYIRSASQADEYRVEPPFKLQGSYRNMNKLAEKTLPIMNDEELKTLILSHYEQESQTLTTGAEANMLKFKEITGFLNDEERARWDEIKATFQKNIKFHTGEDDRLGEFLEQLVFFTDGVDGIRRTLSDIAYFIEASLKKVKG